MAKHKAWKGERVSMLLKVPPKDRVDINSRAVSSGLTISEYLLVLVHRDELDDHGRPLWLDSVDRERQLALPA